MDQRGKSDKRIRYRLERPAPAASQRHRRLGYGMLIAAIILIIIGTLTAYGHAV